MKPGDVLEFYRSGQLQWRGTYLGWSKVKLHKPFRRADGLMLVEIDNLNFGRKILGVSVYYRLGPPLS